MPGRGSSGMRKYLYFLFYLNFTKPELVVGYISYTFGWIVYSMSAAEQGN